jgi:hypothetical protein
MNNLPNLPIDMAIWRVVNLILLSEKKLIRNDYDSVAQLGERHLDRVEVAGSRPVRVTIHNP